VAKRCLIDAINPTTHKHAVPALVGLFLGRVRAWDPTWAHCRCEMCDGGVNDWAESNRIIVLYPQQAAVACWQGCGRALPSDPSYDLYDTRKGRQMGVVNRIVDWIGGH
jgi:hypothetical protein